MRGGNKVFKVTSLKTDGYVNFPYPEPLRLRVQCATELWEGFCQLPTETKLRFSNEDRDKDFGYMWRRDEGPRSERKELFHFSRQTLAELLERADASGVEKATDFIQSVQSLIAEATPLILEFAQAVEEQYCIPGLAADIQANALNWKFRFLHYLGSGEGMLAYEHVDRGGFTLHLHESAEGGEYLGLADRQWHPWPVNHAQTIIFTSMNLQYRSSSELTALYHRVVPALHSPGGERFSVVAFIDFQHDYRLKGRPQDLPVGFNYGLSSDELEEYFVSP